MKKKVAESSLLSAHKSGMRKESVGKTCSVGNYSLIGIGGKDKGAYGKDKGACGKDKGAYGNEMGVWGKGGEDRSHRPSVGPESYIEVQPADKQYDDPDTYCGRTDTEVGTTDAVSNVAVSESEQVDILLDRYIEIESNKRMINENVSWLCLTFKVSPMEDKVSTRIYIFPL